MTRREIREEIFKLLFEKEQDNIVRQKACVLNCTNRIDGNGIFPDRILTKGRFESRCHERVEECNIFAGLIEQVIAVGVVQGIEAIRPFGDVADGKPSAIVCF